MIILVMGMKLEAMIAMIALMNPEIKVTNEDFNIV
jgi:hypothetical protein